MSLVKNVYLLSQSFSQVKWQNWLLQKVEWDKKEWIPRQACIEVFVAEGLAPFIRRNGYEFRCDEYKIGQYIARSMYYYRTNQHPLNNNYMDEDYDYYYFNLNDEKWDSFWNSWSLWEDISEENHKIREIIRHCVWTILDIENSSATDFINNMFYESDDEDGNNERRRDYSIDPYITDAANGYF